MTGLLSVNTGGSHQNAYTHPYVHNGIMDDGYCTVSCLLCNSACVCVCLCLCACVQIHIVCVWICVRLARVNSISNRGNNVSNRVNGISNRVNGISNRVNGISNRVNVE